MHFIYVIYMPEISISLLQNLRYDPFSPWELGSGLNPLSTTKKGGNRFGIVHYDMCLFVGALLCDVSMWRDKVHALHFSLQQKRVYTSLGSPCPQCVHQSWAEYQGNHKLTTLWPIQMTFILVYQIIWCMHCGQEEPKLVAVSQCTCSILENWRMRFR